MALSLRARTLSFLLLVPLFLAPTLTAQNIGEPEGTGLLLLRLADPPAPWPRLPVAVGSVVDSVILADLRFLVVRPSPDCRDPVSALASIPGVAYVAPDRIAPAPSRPSEDLRPIEPSATTRSLLGIDSVLSNDPLVPKQWHIYNDGSEAGWKTGADIDLAEAWRHTRGRPEVVIAVGEEGYDLTHPDLEDLFIDDSALRALANNGGKHGTWVVGVISARAGNNIGGVGVAPGCRILVVHTGYGASTITMLKGLQKVLEWNATVFTNSWGYADIHGQPLQEAYDVVARSGRNGRGTVIIFAAGNDRAPLVTYPGWYERFMSVGGTGPMDNRWLDSDFGQDLDLVAPSQGILTTQTGGGYGVTSGTSFAAPIVAGVAGLVASIDTTITAQQIRQILETTTDHVGGFTYEQSRPSGGWSPWMGYGRVNAGRAVGKALRLRYEERGSIDWPRGGEELRPAGNYTCRWRSDRPAVVISRSLYSGRIDTIGSSSDNGSFSAVWRAPGSDLVRVIVVDSSTGRGVDSSGSVTIRNPLWRTTVDTTSPFIDLNEIPDSLILYIVRSAEHLATPFDLALDGDTAWLWNLLYWGATNAPGNDPRVSVFPTIVPGVNEKPAIFSLMGTDVIGVDSTRIAVVGQPGRRTLIVQYDGLRLDSITAPASLRASVAHTRRQIRFDEHDGSIRLCYDRAIEGRPDDPLRAQRGGYIVGLRTDHEFLLPFDSLWIDRVPAGTITFTPRVSGVTPTPPRTGLFPATGASTSYGYDVYRASVITNGIEGATVRVSSDNGATWTTQGVISPPEGRIAHLIPTRFNGRIIIGIDGEGSLPRADTLEVRDHGYTVEELDTGDGESIAGDPRAATITISSNEDEFVLPMTTPFPFFGISYPAIAIGRDGTIIPLDAQGRAPKFPQIGVYPRFGRDNPDRSAPIRLLLENIDGHSVATIEWDSLSTFGDRLTHRPRAQARLWSNGVIDIHMFDHDTVEVPYYTSPSIGYDGMALLPPVFSLRSNLVAPLALPLGSWRFTPHTPTTAAPSAASGVRLLEIHPNPATTVALIWVNDEMESRLIVRDLLGQTIAELAVERGSREVVWDMRGVPSGLYVIVDITSGARAILIRR